MWFTLGDSPRFSESTASNIAERVSDSGGGKGRQDLFQRYLWRMHSRWPGRTWEACFYNGFEE